MGRVTLGKGMLFHFHQSGIPKDLQHEEWAACQYQWYRYTSSDSFHLAFDFSKIWVRLKNEEWKASDLWEGVSERVQMEFLAYCSSTSAQVHKVWVGDQRRYTFTGTCSHVQRQSKDELLVPVYYSRDEMFTRIVNMDVNATVILGFQWFMYECV